MIGVRVETTRVFVALSAPPHVLVLTYGAVGFYSWLHERGGHRHGKGFKSVASCSSPVRCDPRAEVPVHLYDCIISRLSTTAPSTSPDRHQHGLTDPSSPTHGTLIYCQCIIVRICMWRDQLIEVALPHHGDLGLLWWLFVSFRFYTSVISFGRSSIKAKKITHLDDFLALSGVCLRLLL